MTHEQLSILQCALLLKAALDTRTAALFLRGCQVPVTIAAMVLARRDGPGPSPAMQDRARADAGTGRAS